MGHTLTSRWPAATGVAVFVAGLLSTAVPLTGQAQPAKEQPRGQRPSRGQVQTPRAATPYRAPRSAYRDGHPDLSGIYQAMNFANMDLEDHPMAPGPFWQLGAIGGVPPG